MKKAIIFGMAETALIIDAVAYILRKVEDSQNRNDMNLSDLDDFEIAEDEDEESEEDDDDEVEADSGVCVKTCTLEEAAKYVAKLREDDGTYKPLFPLPDDVKATDLKYAVIGIIWENRASISNLYSEHYLTVQQNRLWIIWKKRVVLEDTKRSIPESSITTN
ncbi:MAG: hypothetical protein LIO74_04030 [Ruminococcus sp.]|nr:hypothetical protein [Ruminococcus sp.]